MVEDTSTDRSDTILWGQRGISPVLGIVFLVAVVIGLSSVAFLFFSGLAGSNNSGAPDVVVEVEWLSGSDDTFAGPGDGAACAGDPELYDDDDGIRLTFETGQPINGSNVEIRVHNSSGVYSPDAAFCSGGDTALDWPSNPPKNFTAGRTYEFYEGLNSNALEPGGKVQIVYNDPEEGESYILVEKTVPEGS